MLFSDFDLLDKHMQEHRSPLSSINDEKGANEKALPSINAINNVSEVTSQKSTLLRMLYKCSECTFISRSRKSVVEHKKTVHHIVVPSVSINEKSRAPIIETTNLESPTPTTDPTVIVPASLAGAALSTLSHKEASKATEKGLTIKAMDAEEATCQ